MKLLGPYQAKKSFSLIVGIFSILIPALVPPVFGAGITHGISVGPGFKFNPDHLTISPGDTVEWAWVGGFHDIASGSHGDHDGHFRAPATSVKGTIFRVTFDGAFLKAHPAPSGHYPYFCLVHLAKGMAGSITVTPAPLPFTRNHAELGILSLPK